MINAVLAVAQVVDRQQPAGFGAWFFWTIAKLIVVFTVYMLGVAYLTLAERKISAWIQRRLGPNRVGPRGLFQPLADGLVERHQSGGVVHPAQALDDDLPWREVDEVADRLRSVGEHAATSPVASL